MRKAAIFQMTHSDAIWIMCNVRKIIQSIRTVWKVNESPPVIGPVMHGKTVRVYYDPIQLIKSRPIINDKSKRQAISHFLNCHYQLKATKDDTLIDKLIQQQYKYQSIISRNEIIEELSYCIKHSPPEFQLCWSSVFEYDDIEKWYALTVPEYIYRSKSDKEDPNKKPELIQIPFVKNGWTQYLSILQLCNITFEQQPCIIPPFTSCLAITSYFESIFMLSSSIYI